MRSRAGRVIRTMALLAAAGASSALGQNLVVNGGFATDLNGWQQIPNGGGTSSWSDQDASGSASSGSALLTSTSSAGGVSVRLLSQCIPVTGGISYELSANVRYSTTDPDAGAAEAWVDWMSDSACQNSITGAGLLMNNLAPESWQSHTTTFTAPFGAIYARFRLGVLKHDGGGQLSAWVDDVVLAPVESVVGWLAVAGSVHGAFGSNFKTSVQVFNPNGVPFTGRFVFHPAGAPAGPSDPSMSFTLPAGETIGWDDVVLAMGASGIGSLDVYSDAGFPLVLAHIFDDAGASGTKGFTERMVSIGDIPFPPTARVTGYLLAPRDVSRFRFNVGVRTLDAPATLSVYVRDAQTNLRTSLVKNYPANYFEQKPSTEFLDGLELGADDSIEITFTGGPVIVYGATVDNATNDPSAQFLPYLYWILT